MPGVLLLGLLSPGIAAAASDDGDPGQACRQGDRGRLLRFERVASHPTAADARAYFDSWVEFYQDFYQVPANLPVDIDHGFDTYKVTSCTVDVAPPGTARPAPTVATGNVSVPRKAGPLSTVAYLHGTSVSFYDARSNPNVFGELCENGESFDGPPSSAVFAGAGFIYVGPDHLGLGDSTVPRHRYFHAATEASSAADLLAVSRDVLARLRVRRSDELLTFGFSQGGHAALALQRLLERRRGLRPRALLPVVDREHDRVDGSTVRLVHPAGLRRHLLLTASYFRAVSSNPDEPLRAAAARYFSTLD